MRILYVVHQFFPQWYTGTERFVLNNAKALQKMGHYVEVLTYGYNDETDYTIFDGVMYKQYTYQHIPVISIKNLSLTEDLNFSISNEELTQFLQYFLHKESFDIIHIAHPMRLGSIVKVGKSLGIPIVLTLTDFWLRCPRAIAVTQKGDLCESADCGYRCRSECYGSLGDSKCIDRFDEAKELLYCVDYVTAPSGFLANNIHEEFDIDVHVIRHGIDYAEIKTNRRYRMPGDEIVFGYIGTVIPHKGVHIITQSLNYVDSLNVKIKIYGSCFSETRYFEELQHSVNKDPRVEFLGEYKDEEMPSIMGSIDLVIVPSMWWENSPLTVLTSLAYKVPVITINLGGAAEFIKDGINGFNFKIGDPKDLSNIIKRIAEKPDIINLMKDGIVRPRRVEEEAFEYEAIYRKLVLQTET